VEEAGKSAPWRGGAKVARFRPCHAFIRSTRPERLTFAPPLGGAGSPHRPQPRVPSPLRGSVTRGYGSKAPSGLPSRSERCPPAPAVEGQSPYSIPAPAGPPSRSGDIEWRAASKCPQDVEQDQDHEGRAHETDHHCPDPALDADKPAAAGVDFPNRPEGTPSPTYEQ
jgi:hypothetical protein